jgi:protein dithiol:quinone oxidoreductase
MNMNSVWASRRKLLMLTALLSWGAVGIALILQYQFNMRPCPWCTLQRLAYLCIGAIALIGLLIPYTINRILSLVGILCALSGIYMAGYQHFVASKTECMFTWPDKFLMKIGADSLAPWMFRATAQCSEANQPLLGLPFSWWSAVLFVLLATLLVRSFITK